MYTLDTNAVIYYLKDDPSAVPVLRDVFGQDVPLYISAVTEIELFWFPNLTVEETAEIERILGTLLVIPVDSRIAQLAGSIRRIHRLKIPDSAIAATALATGTSLLTRNARDFKSIPNLKVVKI